MPKLKDALKERMINIPSPGGRARIGEVEARLLNQICNLEGLQTSEAVRTLIREGAKVRGLWPPRAEVVHEYGSN